MESKKLTLQFFLTAIQSVAGILFDWSKMSQHFHELPKIDAIVCAISEKCMNNSIA